MWKHWPYVSAFLRHTKDLRETHFVRGYPRLFCGSLSPQPG